MSICFLLFSIREILVKVQSHFNIFILKLELSNSRSSLTQLELSFCPFFGLRPKLHLLLLESWSDPITPPHFILYKLLAHQHLKLYKWCPIKSEIIIKNKLIPYLHHHPTNHSLYLWASC